MTVYAWQLYWAYLGPSSHSWWQCDVQGTAQALQAGQGDSSRQKSAAAGTHISLIACCWNHVEADVSTLLMFAVVWTSAAVT